MCAWDIAFALTAALSYVTAPTEPLHHRLVHTYGLTRFSRTTTV